MVTILLGILAGAILLFVFLYFFGMIILIKQEREKEKYRRSVAAAKLELEFAPYVIVVNPDNKLIYEDKQRSQLVNALTLYHKEGLVQVKRDPEKEIENIIFIRSKWKKQ